MEIIRDIFQQVPLSFVVAWWAIDAISAFLFIVGVRKHVHAWRQGIPEQISGSSLSRFARFIYVDIAQAKVLNKKFKHHETLRSSSFPQQED